MCRAIWKAAGGHHSGEFQQGHCPGAAEGIPCAGPILEQLHAIVRVTSAFLGTNPRLNSVKSSLSIEKSTRLFGEGLFSLLAGRERFEDLATRAASWKRGWMSLRPNARALSGRLFLW